MVLLHCKQKLFAYSISEHLACWQNPFKEPYVPSICCNYQCYHSALLYGFIGKGYRVCVCVCVCVLCVHVSVCIVCVHVYMCVLRIAT